MSAEQDQLGEPRIIAAVEELSALIKGQHPDARFEVGRGEDPEGVYLRVIVGTEDLDAVADLFMDRLVELQVEDGLSLYVVPVYPLEQLPGPQTGRSAARVA